MQKTIISANEAGQRFDKYLHKYLKEATNSFIYKMLRKKNIELNGKKASGNEILVAGDEIGFFMADETISKFRGISIDDKNPNVHSKNETKAIINTKNVSLIKANLIYEDEHVLIVNKPAGILSQKSVPADVSINEMIIDYLLSEQKLTDKELETFKPSVCNRLDRNTTGLITFGKSLKGIQELSYGFKERTFDKYYLAVVWGKITDSKVIEGYLIKDLKTNKVTISSTKSEDSSYIKTAYEPLANTKINVNNKSLDITLLKIKLITGKTHQIRAHLSSINHGLLGDDKYGNREKNNFLKKKFGIMYQLLHSYELKFDENNSYEALAKICGKTIVAAPSELYKKLFDNYCI